MRRTRLLIALLIALGVTGGLALLMRDGTERLSQSNAARTPSKAIPAGAKVSLPEEQRFVGRGATLVDLEQASLRASFHASGMLIRVYTGRSVSGSYECLIYAEPKGFGASCDPKLLTKRKVEYLESFDGGPDPQTMTNRHVAGVVDPVVGSLAIVNDRGDSRPVPLAGDYAFLYVVPPAELRAGIEPVELIAFDRSGREIERIALK